MQRTVPVLDIYLFSESKLRYLFNLCLDNTSNRITKHLERERTQPAIAFSEWPNRYFLVWIAFQNKNKPEGRVYIKGPMSQNGLKAQTLKHIASASSSRTFGEFEHWLNPIMDYVCHRLDSDTYFSARIFSLQFRTLTKKDFFFFFLSPQHLQIVKLSTNLS